MCLSSLCCCVGFFRWALSVLLGTSFTLLTLGAMVAFREVTAVVFVLCVIGGVGWKLYRAVRPAPKIRQQ